MRRWFWVLLGGVVLGVVAWLVPRSAVEEREGSEGEGDGEPGEAEGPGRCKGSTRSGERCAREARDGSRFCWQHG